MSHAQFFVGCLRRIADDHDGEVHKLVARPDDVEERRAHVELGAVEHERLGAMLQDQIVDARREPVVRTSRS